MLEWFSGAMTVIAVVCFFSWLGLAHRITLANEQKKQDDAIIDTWRERALMAEKEEARLKLEAAKKQYGLGASKPS